MRESRVYRNALRDYANLGVRGEGVFSGAAGPTRLVAQPLPGRSNRIARTARSDRRSKGGGLMTRVARVLIVDDHKLVAEAISTLLETESMKPVGVVTSGSDAPAAVAALRPDIVLLD